MLSYRGFSSPLASTGLATACSNNHVLMRGYEFAPCMTVLILSVPGGMRMAINSISYETENQNQNHAIVGDQVSHPQNKNNLKVYIFGGRAIDIHIGPLYKDCCYM
jgi:hypothetical protein